MFSNRHLTLLRAAAAVLTLATVAAWPANARAAATITIVNGDPAGVGFNDPTVAAPVGGNPGTTLGQQRLNAFQAAANKWGATLTSAVTIRVLATWEPLTCTATGAVLGSAGATEVFRNFTGSIPGHWYGKAQANAMFGAELDPATADIRARFNANLGQPGCLTGIFFYLGLDNNHGTNVDLVSVLLHEFGHGLGFQTFTNASNGAQLAGFPSIWDDFLLDTTIGKTWTQMTSAERAASGVNTGRLVWNGANVAAAVPTVLQSGNPQLTIASPASVAGTYLVGTAAFGPALSNPGVTAEVKQVADQPNGISLACNSFITNVFSGKIALIDRGVCGFTVKVANAQAAGAVGVLIADNAAGSPPVGLGGTDPSITIPSVRITQADGITLKNVLKTGSRLRSGVIANMGINLAAFAGADALGRVLMYAPVPFAAGSSVSHWDVSAFPNLLMEPAINGDLTHEVTPPFDLTYRLLKDIGWQ